eukprot:11164700-Lingulodinium_polyedra.AAC.1
MHSMLSLRPPAPLRPRRCPRAVGHGVAPWRRPRRCPRAARFDAPNSQLIAADPGLVPSER